MTDTPLKQIAKWGWLLFLLGVVLALVWDGLGEPARPSSFPAMSDPIISEDDNQSRLNSVPPSPREDWYTQQDFVAGHDGLSKIELILASPANTMPTASKIWYKATSRRMVTPAVITTSS
ncbi:MAG: hypothetical protein GY796_15340 [Chloroflexi bacterium]|nr:hypothetical protein [Chloroflexota bacterium]